VKPKSTFHVSWVDIEEPTRRHSPGRADGLGVYSQGKKQGATTFARLEGCWGGHGRIYFVSTSGGDARLGQVWEYLPRDEQLRLLFESPASHVLDYPDNVTMSPRGGLVLCEDGERRVERLCGLSQEGELFPFAENHVKLVGEKNSFHGDFTQHEWCGSTFSPDGQWLFANLQTPGITVAITGPWDAGPL
jgi:secreted PhoX family phosphatase